MDGELLITTRDGWSGDDARPRAASLRIADGRIVAVDDDAPVGGARHVDVPDGFLLPGLVDAHLHLLMGGLALTELDLSGARSREAFMDAIARRHAELPPGRWLLARGWSQDRWGGAMPDRAWLAAAGDRPVACWRADIHAVLVNDAALADVDLREPIAGGAVVRDADGRPTGLLLEAAAWERLQPRIPVATPAQRREAVRAAKAHLLSLGVTSVGAMESMRDTAEVLAPERGRPGPRCRIMLLDADDPPSLAEAADLAPDVALSVIGCKAFVDGTLGSRTARMLEDYADDPGNRGLLVGHAAEPGRLEAWAATVARAGLMPCMHAIGDEAVRRALDAADAARAANPLVTVRIEHAQQVRAEDRPRFAGRIASVQPTHLLDDGPILGSRLGAARVDDAYPLAALHEAGATLAFGSDWPVVPPDPIAALAAAITGRDGTGSVPVPGAVLPVETALHASTRDAARAIGRGGAGLLRPGAPADAVVLDRDPFTADWTTAPPRVRLTMVGGVVLHRA